MAVRLLNMNRHLDLKIVANEMKSRNPFSGCCSIVQACDMHNVKCLTGLAVLMSIVTVLMSVDGVQAMTSVASGHGVGVLMIILVVSVEWSERVDGRSGQFALCVTPRALVCTLAASTSMTGHTCARRGH